MPIRHTAVALALFVFAATASASDIIVREFGSHVIEHAGHAPVTPVEERHALADGVQSALADGVESMSRHTPPQTFRVYPVAGTVGRDLVIPYYVDLDPSEGKLDWNCGDQTFNGHMGHDPYIRSFAEQAIGVPVFAALDGVVIDVHDGEPDQNTTNAPGLRPNYVTIQHTPGHTTMYVHLKRNSIGVAEGEYVTAGTQIGMVGSSGPSTGPHIHFEARHGGVAYEPFAGPCRPGKSHFRNPPGMFARPLLVGATLSSRSFENDRPAPFDDATRTGTFLRGRRTIYVKADMANIGATTRYELTLRQPNSDRVMTASSGTLTKYDASLASVWWGLDVDLHTTGTWTLTLNVNDRESFSMPFTVVSSSAEQVNRPPNAITAALEPITPIAGQVPVCRAMAGFPADPDYDVVRYRYEWRVGDEVVRDVTTAAQSDVLARQHLRHGATLSCTVTASDGVLQTQPSSAFGTVASQRRRAVRR